MRKTATVATIVVVAVLGLGGTAYAAAITGTPGPDVVLGTNSADMINPLGGEDAVMAQAGNDTINARDGEQDSVSCGDGFDTVIADSALIDAVGFDCERVERA